MRNDQGRPVERLNDIGHGEGLAGASDAQQGLKLVALLESVDQFLDGLGLIARRLVFRMKHKMVHTCVLSWAAMCRVTASR